MKDVRIKYTTKQNDVNSEWTTRGTIEYENHGYVLHYPDYTGNTVTENLMTVSSDEIILERTGAIESIMVFQKDIITPFDYQAILVHDTLEVFTKDLKVIENGKLIDINLSYELFGYGEKINNTQMHIEIEIMN